MLKARALLFVLVLLAAAPGFAQEGAAAATAVQSVEGTPFTPETYGTGSLTAITLTVFDCDTFSQADTWSPIGGTPNRFITAGFFECAFRAPAGSAITVIEIEGCDTNAGASINASLLRAVSPGGGGLTVASVNSGATPGCGRFAFTLPSPHQVDNNTEKYFFQVTTGATSATTLAALRVYYRLQVSPAPAVATFADVPTTHIFFRFIEAFSRASITGGCNNPPGSGNFCPNDPVTRGQMATFLALALGLHFPD